MKFLKGLLMLVCIVVLVGLATCSVSVLYSVGQQASDPNSQMNRAQKNMNDAVENMNRANEDLLDSLEETK